MSSQKIITIFAATGNQGSSVINVLLLRLAEKYSLRGVTRDRTSAKSRALVGKGVQMVEADFDDAESVKAAVRGSHGVFINTDYWSLLDKAKEIRQGIMIFDACKEANVQHVVVSSLPNVSRLSEGKFTGVAHFDSKAAIAEYAGANKGVMVVSYFQPAMYFENIKQASQDQGGVTYISLPYADPHFDWPMISPSRDTGKYVAGLFEAGDRADGVTVQGVSAWTTPTKVADTMAKHLGRDVQFKPIDAKTYEQYLPENIRDEISEMMQWIGESSYYGKGSEAKQAESDKFILPGEQLTSWEKFLELEF